MKLAPDTVSDLDKVVAVALELAAAASKIRGTLRASVRDGIAGHAKFLDALHELADLANTLDPRAEDIEANLETVNGDTEE